MRVTTGSDKPDGTNVMRMPLARLWSRDFVAACLANFFLFFSFFILLPVLPIYINDVLKADQTLTGFVLATYTLAALSVRPFAGRLVDTMPRRAVYLMTYAVFTLLFGGYFLAISLLIMGLLRFAHGLFFGVLSTSASTIAIDTIPRDLLGSGIGIFGTASALAMAVGPMCGLWVLETWSFHTVFAVSLCFCSCGFLICLQVRPAPSERPVKQVPFSWGTLILENGKIAMLSFGSTTFIYGMFTTYLPVFAKEKGLGDHAGLVYCLFAVGLVLSRFFAGRRIDNGNLVQVIIQGKILLILAFLPFIFTVWESAFVLAALCIGFGYGMIFPAYQALFNNLAAPSQRGTANSTFLTALDAGICVAVFSTGVLADIMSFSSAYLTGVGGLVFSLVLFFYHVGPRYEAKKQQ